MDKKRYWKKQFYIADFIYRNAISDKIMQRAFNIVCEIDDHLFDIT